MPPPHHPPSLPSPPSTDNDVTHKKPSKRTKSSKPGPRGAKRVTAAAAQGGGSGSRSPEMGDGRHKRVWKACERCRMKKTKCDGESPCKRCRDDGLVCTAGHRKKAEFKQLPRGYAEVLENTQYALIATVHKLYAMVLAGEQWTLEPPVVNARGQPVIHDIAAKLGCIRADPSREGGGAMEFPADAAEFAELQRRLESEERAGAEGGEMSGGMLSAVTGPESQFGDDSFCDDFDPGFEMEDDFPDVDGAGGYGDVSPFSDGPVGGFGMDGLQSLQQGYEEFIPASSSSPALPSAAVAGVQMRLPTQLQLSPQQQQQQQAALRAQQARQMQILQQQQQQQSLDFRDQQSQWVDPATMEEQMRALMRGGMYPAGAAGGGAMGGMGMGAMGGDGTIRPNLLECGFGAGGGIDNEDER